MKERKEKKVQKKVKERPNERVNLIKRFTGVVGCCMCNGWVTGWREIIKTLQRRISKLAQGRGDEHRLNKIKEKKSKEKKKKR